MAAVARRLVTRGGRPHVRRDPISGTGAGDGSVGLVTFEHQGDLLQAVKASIRGTIPECVDLLTYPRAVGLPDDARAALLSLTPAGKEVVALMRQRLVAGIDRHLRMWTADECRVFATLLARFVERGPLADALHAHE